MSTPTPTPKTLPIIEGEITLNPSDPEVIKILSTLCFRAAPIAQTFRTLGYPIPTHAEEEQAYIIAWMLAMHQKHGPLWRTEAANFLRAAVNASKKTS